MENGNFKEAEEVFERIFDDPNSYEVVVYIRIRILELLIWSEVNKRALEEERDVLSFKQYRTVLSNRNIIASHMCLSSHIKIVERN